jgi:FMN phosphatase YigB (HAD superfamily)
MVEVLKKLKLHKNDALMVGDSYFYDYLAAKDMGIDALLIENNIAKMPEIAPVNLQSIKEVSDILHLMPHGLRS